jgi:hypothetical protein
MKRARLKRRHWRAAAARSLSVSMVEGFLEKAVEGVSGVAIFAEENCFISL